MSSANRESCLFIQLLANPDRLPDSMTSACDVLADVEVEPTTAAMAYAEAKAIADALGTPVCSVGGCGISISGLLRYVTSAGADAPRQALDEVVAPSCALLDVPHNLDTELGPFCGKWPDSPLA